ncbi:hypothetical protein [Pedobacter sp. Leaf250]|uniref:hypothetical protein n=1 Tax=Pedobacter sp. Leaf250 TaxID=2876559 RepID=UPI001E5FFE89|nr:hypothetical protein [Pedobacter sp. Leaf250]
MKTLSFIIVRATQEKGYILPEDLEFGESLVQHADRTQIYTDAELEYDDRMNDRHGFI